MDLTDEEAMALQQVCQLHPHILQAGTALQHFAQMLRERRGGEVDHWMQTTFATGISELRSLVRKLRQDHDAVQAGLTFTWNNGRVEGHINLSNI